jgi:hypothetical protein
MSADRLPLLVEYGEGDDRYEEEEEEVKADDFELRAMVDGHVLSHGKSERRPTTGMAGQAGEESSTPSTPAPAPRCLPTYVALAICMIILLLLFVFCLSFILRRFMSLLFSVSCRTQRENELSMFGEVPQIAAGLPGRKRTSGFVCLWPPPPQ